MEYLIIILIVLAIIFVDIKLFLTFFYRDPKRIPPKSSNLILSPADGKICYIKYIKSGEVVYSEKNNKKINLSEITNNNIDKNIDYILIGIYMGFLDVHFQRAPIDGIVYNQTYIKGKFLDLIFSKRIPEFEGERNVIFIKSFDGMNFSIVLQIASVAVRRIVSYVNINDKVKKGEKIGQIKFGSQVDLIIPADNVKLKIKENEKVKAGETIIGEYNDG
jgi:phosphatidylserine decarboxylase